METRSCSVLRSCCQLSSDYEDVTLQDMSKLLSSEYCGHLPVHQMMSPITIQSPASNPPTPQTQVLHSTLICHTSNYISEFANNFSSEYCRYLPVHQMMSPSSIQSPASNLPTLPDLSTMLPSTPQLAHRHSIDQTFTGRHFLNLDIFFLGRTHEQTIKIQSHHEYQILDP